MILLAYSAIFDSGINHTVADGRRLNRPKGVLCARSRLCKTAPFNPVVGMVRQPQYYAPVPASTFDGELRAEEMARNGDRPRATGLQPCDACEGNETFSENCANLSRKANFDKRTDKASEPAIHRNYYK